MMRGMPALPSFSTRTPGFVVAEPGRGRGRFRRIRRPHMGRTRSIDGLVAQVIAAVNARGLCAAQVCKLASLPESEVAFMATRCGCGDCFVLRAN
jgi:hypothetical protein